MCKRDPKYDNIVQLRADGASWSELATTYNVCKQSAIDAWTARINNPDYQPNIVDYETIQKMREQGSTWAECSKYAGIGGPALRRGLAIRGLSNYRYQPQKHNNATKAVRRAIRDGKLIRQPCEMCGLDGTYPKGRPKVHAHHDNYDKPLDVRWLCVSCHRKVHYRIDRQLSETMLT